MDRLTIWHNPRCSKSRAALAILQERGHDVEVIRYLDEPPDAAELQRVIGMLGIEPRELIRTKEKCYGELGLADVADDKELIQAMVDNPVLIERPVVIRGKQARIGRPPEQILELLR